MNFLKRNSSLPPNIWREITRPNEYLLVENGGERSPSLATMAHSAKNAQSQIKMGIENDIKFH